MKPKAHSCLFLSLSLFLFFSSPDLLAESPGIPGDDAPKVVRIDPENGAGDVDPGLDEIKITFSEPMTDRSWSVTGGGENFPDIKSIYYTKNCTVLVMKVKLILEITDICQDMLWRIGQRPLDIVVKLRH